jgi:protein-tyrosine phosphatase
MAEGILKDKFLLANYEVTVDSCGFESFHIGDPPDSRAITVTRKHGIDISSHRARLFRDRDFKDFDLIFVMDSSHYRNVMKRAVNHQDRSKVDYFLNVVHPGRNEDVADPWYHDMDAFEKVFVQLDVACDLFVKQITKMGR